MTPWISKSMVSTKSQPLSMWYLHQIESVEATYSCDAKFCGSVFLRVIASLLPQAANSAMAVRRARSCLEHWVIVSKKQQRNRMQLLRRLVATVALAEEAGVG